MPHPVSEISKVPARWYFDVVSPFAYLQFTQLERFDADCRIECVPILFAGLLNHWQHKGPAEIPAKRQFVYRQCTWLAAKRGTPFRFPPRHPFNPLATLRLIVALGASRSVVKTVFEFIFAAGRDITAPGEFSALGSLLGITDPAGLIESSEVKQRLRENTEAAIAAGVFGVPTLICRDQLFWGDDATAMAAEFLREPGMFERPEMLHVDAIGIGATR